MAKTALSVTVRPAQQQVSRQADVFTSTPSNNLRGWTTTDAYLDGMAGAAYIKPVWKPSSYPYGKDDYYKNPATDSLWSESSGALGKGDKGIGFTGSSTVPATTPWFAVVDSTHSIARNRGVVISFIWYRPSDDATVGLKIMPRVDPNVFGVVGGAYYYFSPFHLAIDQQMRMRVYEYPYDTYEPFNANPLIANTQVYSHPLVVTSDEVASQWHSVQIQALSDDDVLVTSDILQGGGFVYRSAMDRQNIWMLPEGMAGVQAVGGGTGQVQVTPLETATTGTIKSGKLSKTAANAEYPTVKVFGWSPALIETDRGYLDGDTIASGATGTGGIKYNVYSVVTNPGGSETEALVDPVGGVEFQYFKVEVTMTPVGYVSPVINDIVVDYAGATAAVTGTVVDISDDVMELKGQLTDEGSKYNLKIRNQDGKYNAIAERPMSEVDINIGGEDVAVVYTLNPSYDWLTTPTEGALTLNWETGDGFEYLKRELCAKMPAYDGQLLSDCLTEFMGRLGYDASRLDIDATPNIRLPKKRGKEPYQFKPEDGTPAYEFVQKLKEWFASTHKCRFGRGGKFEFKEVAEGLPTISRTYYPASVYKPDPDDHVIYKGPQIELLMNEFYNEIWVVGEDKRQMKPLVSVYRDAASQTDKNSPNYVGRRLLMIVLTKCNTQGALDTICNRLSGFYGEWGIRVKFKTRLDPLLQKDDFVKIHGGGAVVWRVENIDHDVSEGTMASSAINSTTAPIVGMTVTASQWAYVI